MRLCVGDGLTYEPYSPFLVPGLLLVSLKHVALAHPIITQELSPGNKPDVRSTHNIIVYLLK